MELVEKLPYRFATAIAALILPLFLLAMLFHNLETARAQAPAWENLRIYGGTVYDAAIDPATGRAYLITGDIPGLYWSDDKGENWQADLISWVGGAGSIEIGPDGALYATVTSGFKRSTNGGKTWTALVDESKAAYAASILGSDIDANNFEHMLIATGGSQENDAAVYSTSDGGTKWITATLTISPSAELKDVAIDPTRPGVVYATSRDFLYQETPSYIYRSTDGGLSFTPIFTAPTGVQFQQIGVNSLGTVYAGSSAGVYRSENGIDWNFSAQGGRMVAFGAHNSGTIYSDHAASYDNGLTWERSQINTFIADSSADPDLLLTAAPIGIQRSLDGGSNWEDCVSGIDQLEILAITFDPFDNQILYAATSLGAARSLDAGATWKLPLGELKLRINDLSVDPKQSGVLYLGASDGRVYKSTDYGETFTTTQIAIKTNYEIWDLLVNPGRTNNLYTALLMPADTGMLYGGMYRSEDFGTTWLTITMKAKQVNTLQAGQLLTNTVIYAGLGDYWNGVGLDGGGVYRSLDGGKSWLSVGMKNKVVTTLAVDPRAGRIVYAGMGTAFDSGYGQYLYRSDDMGENWSALPLDIETFSIQALNVDANDADTIYACTLDQVYISTDSGQTWSSFYTSRYGEQCRGIYSPQQGPEPVKFLDPGLSGNTIQLQWENPNDQDLSGVNLRVLTSTFPTAHTLGISLTTQTAIPGSVGTYEYGNAKPGTTYYFTAFSLDKAGHFSSPAYISMTIPAAWTSSLQSIDQPTESILKVQTVYLAAGKSLLRYIDTRIVNTLYFPFIIRK